MASTFRILFNRNREKLNLELMGEFDGSSAYQLINTLKDNYGKNGGITVRTCGLSSIHPFGLVVFHKKWAVLTKKFRDITFTGKHGDTIAPPSSNLI